MLGHIVRRGGGGVLQRARGPGCPYPLPPPASTRTDDGVVPEELLTELLPPVPQ